MAILLSINRTIRPDNTNIQMVKHTNTQIWIRDGRQVV